MTFVTFFAARFTLRCTFLTVFLTDFFATFFAAARFFALFREVFRADLLPGLRTRTIPIPCAMRLTLELSGARTFSRVRLNELLGVSSPTP